MPDEFVNVRYMVDDVENAVAFYTAHFAFELHSSAAPAFADVIDDPAGNPIELFRPGAPATVKGA